MRVPVSLKAHQSGRHWQRWQYCQPGCAFRIVLSKTTSFPKKGPFCTDMSDMSDGSHGDDNLTSRLIWPCLCYEQTYRCCYFIVSQIGGYQALSPSNIFSQMSFQFECQEAFESKTQLAGLTHTNLNKYLLDQDTLLDSPNVPQ